MATSAAWSRGGAEQKDAENLRIADVVAKMAASSDNMKRKRQQKILHPIQTEFLHI